MAKVGTFELARISARGIVQGVGFRPFVYQLASRYNLKGWVCNTSEDVKIEIQGESKDLKRFLSELQNNAPPLAHIESISVTYHPPAEYTSFEIRHSIAEEGKYQPVSPDIATCQACLEEIFRPEDRRYHYPFTNCTNCGPRFTIIEDVPYDRPNTTMRSFIMCPDCQAEYDNPLDRRFHAQPNACPKCGPSLELVDTKGNQIETSDVIVTASQLLKHGKIIAIKGLGGFLLACDATNEKAVKVLRQRKRRPFKPLAIMVADMEEARMHCLVSETEGKLLTSQQSPIVLLQWKQDSTVCQAVAPNLKYLGVMLPYTPLHHLFIREVGLPLVMTSGNISEEPIAKDNDEALRRLSGIADYFLVHNRDIYARYDDSVTCVEHGTAQVTRRARSYAPYPIHLDFKAKPVLGCGAEEKNTFCLTKDSHAFVSQHIGDMENLETLEHFENTLALYKRLFRIEPETIAYDLHPEYLSTKYALELGSQFSHLKLVPIQHHHAHIVSCMTDNGVESTVIGVALDGTGYGSDGRIWGGEFLVADYKDFQRMGHLEYLPLPGGVAAIKKPYRTAAGYLIKLLGENSLKNKLAFLKQIDTVEIELIKRQIQTGLNSPLCSSMGRLFDAVSALIDVRGEIDYEGQAAVELEMIAYDGCDEVGNKGYPYSIVNNDVVNIIQLKELLSTIVEDLYRGVSKTTISAMFHNAVAQMICEMCQLIAKRTGINQVALSGGVFQNRLLLREVVPLLKAADLSVLTHKHIPCNDGGISLGQAVIANFI
ncbi:MAG: carbamoyltransferase HypF [Chloroflexota bacterium]|nr:MAG: carbamoyltransferase HypF [Chloroflexota bacterium]